MAVSQVTTEFAGTSSKVLDYDGGSSPRLLLHLIPPRCRVVLTQHLIPYLCGLLSASIR
jgi:hypothetical protein